MGKSKRKSKHNEVTCPPQYVVRDHYTHRVVKHVHPIVNIHRENIVYVPQHVYKHRSQKVVFDPGYGPFCC
jgi:hypothetical protein